MTLTLGVGTSILCATHLLIILYLLCSFIKFAPVVYVHHNFRHNLTSDLIVCDLDLGGRNLTLVRDTPSHYLLYFCEVLLNLL